MLKNLPHRGHLETGYVRLRKRRRRLNAISVFLFCSLAGLFVGAGMLAHQFSLAREAAADRARWNGQIRELQQVMLQLQAAETAQRGYLLTDDPAYLEPYRRAARDLPPMIRSMSLTTDGAGDKRLQYIYQLGIEKLTELGRTIQLHDDGNRDAALTLVKTGVGKRYMEQANAAIFGVIEDLRTRRDAADARVLSGISAVNRWTLVTLAALTICIGLFFVQIRALASGRQAYENTLATQTAMLNLVIDEIPAMVAIWDRDLRYRLVNKSFERWRGRSRDRIIGQTVQQVLGPTEYALSQPFIERALRGESVTYEKDYPGKAVSHITATYNPLFLEGGEVDGIVAIAHDVTAERAEQHRLKLLSERDVLTGLMNRAGFEAFLTDAMEKHAVGTLALIYVDLDHFKPVNDRFGHAAGDEVLRMFAARMQHLVRPTDAVARLGGDEFAIALPEVRSQEDVRRIAEKVLVAAHEPFAIEAGNAQISASIGVAMNAASEDCAGLIERADKKAYEAKAAGRDCVRA